MMTTLSQSEEGGSRDLTEMMAVKNYYYHYYYYYYKMACRWCVWGECWYHGGGGWSDGTLRCAQCGKAKQVNDFSRNPRSKGSARRCQYWRVAKIKHDFSIE